MEELTLTPEQLNKIEMLASIFTPIGKIAKVMGLDPIRLRAAVKDATTEAYARYEKGKLTSEIELRKQEMTLAKVGSPLALENTRHNLMEMEEDE